MRRVCILSARCVPWALYCDADGLDTGTPAWVASVGLLKADGTDLSTAEADGGAVWGSGITISQAGGQVAVLSQALARVTPTDGDRQLGIKVTTAAHTAASGTVGLTLMYRRSEERLAGKERVSPRRSGGPQSH